MMLGQTALTSKQSHSLETELTDLPHTFVKPRELGCSRGVSFGKAQTRSRSGSGLKTRLALPATLRLATITHFTTAVTQVTFSSLAKQLPSTIGILFVKLRLDTGHESAAVFQLHGSAALE